jgi:cellulose synthase (UDP-forming)
VVYNEPVAVIEPTVMAALNMNYPGAKLTVHVLDDGRKPEVYKMARRMDYQCRWSGRSAAGRAGGSAAQVGVCALAPLFELALAG